MVFKIKSEWLEFFKPEFAKPYFQKLVDFLKVEYDSFRVFPHQFDIFKAFNISPSKVTVVILGQDPYHGLNQANGLAFSVHQDIPFPPSLQNIQKELFMDTKEKLNSPDLTSWVSQGVILLNTTLTVREGEPNSHKDRGWELFTDFIIKHLSDFNKPKVFILWGKKAEAKLHLIDTKRNRVLISAHPSPFSASNGFFGSKPFSACNTFLKELGHEQIIWATNKVKGNL